ncbi:MAG: DUF2971 domain-containing protein, partial [Candidatus Dadabacteria bacterium]|nr:DUF2971 domain-containing protein [Candidatus Dadabacteria bacterium]
GGKGAAGQGGVRKGCRRARLMDPDQTFFNQFSQPPQVLYRYIPAHRLDDALPDEKPCFFRVTPPNELNDINEINFKPLFVDDKKNHENINREYALTLTELCPASPISVDDVERYRQKHSLGYGAKLTCDQLSKRYGVTSFSTRKNDVKMWSHYADDCRGIVIGYNVDLWVSHLFGTSIIREVKYADELPIIIGPRVVNQENVYAFMSSKGAAWEYEQEWRLITELSKTQESAKGIAVITVPQESVSSILITDRTSQDTVDIIVQRLNNPSNNYRIWSIDQMQRGHDPTKLAFIGQMKTRTSSTIKPCSQS